MFRYVVESLLGISANSILKGQVLIRLICYFTTVLMPLNFLFPCWFQLHTSHKIFPKPRLNDILKILLSSFQEILIKIVQTWYNISIVNIWARQRHNICCSRKTRQMMKVPELSRFEAVFILPPPLPIWSFWGPLETIFNFAGGAALQAVSEWPPLLVNI